jgi:hypothetical protein
MHSFTPLRRAVLAAVLGAAGLACVLPAAQAQSITGGQQIGRQLTAQAMATAQRDFAQFAAHQLQVRSGGVPIDFPLEITDLQDLKEATISYGFPVYTIDPPELMAGRGSMQNMVRPTPQWRFVIALRGRPIGMATVERNQGKFETVAYGAAVLAKDVDALMGFHGNADKSNLRFVRVYQARSDLLEVVGQDGRARFAPLHSARESLLLQQRASKDGKRSEDLMDEAELVQPLRSAVKLNMAAPQ